MGAGDGLAPNCLLVCEASPDPRCAPTTGSFSKTSQSPNLDHLHPTSSSSPSSICFPLPICRCLKKIFFFCSRHNWHSNPAPSLPSLLPPPFCPGPCSWASSPFWHFLPLLWIPQNLLQDEEKLSSCRMMDFVCPSQYFKELLTNL